MGLFDNATSVTIDGVEVSSILIDGGSIYTKSIERNVSFSFEDPFGEPVVNADITIVGGDVEINRTTGSAGGCTATLSDGEYLIGGGNGIYIVPQATSITVDAEHTSFTIQMQQDI